MIIRPSLSWHPVTMPLSSNTSAAPFLSTNPGPLDCTHSSPWICFIGGAAFFASPMLLNSWNVVLFSMWRMVSSSSRIPGQGLQLGESPFGSFLLADICTARMTSDVLALDDALVVQDPLERVAFSVVRAFEAALVHHDLMPAPVEARFAKGFVILIGDDLHQDKIAKRFFIDLGHVIGFYDGFLALLPDLWMTVDVKRQLLHRVGCQ